MQRLEEMHGMMKQFFFSAIPVLLAVASADARTLCADRGDSARFGKARRS